MIIRRHRWVGRRILMVDAISAISFSRVVRHGVKSRAMSEVCSCGCGKYSSLLRNFNEENVFMNNLKGKLEFKKQ
jgi:hypothetical protein